MAYVWNFTPSASSAGLTFSFQHVRQQSASSTSRKSHYWPMHVTRTLLPTRIADA